MIFVWGLHLGVAGVALGTALGAWINVGDPDLVGPQPRLAGHRESISCAPCRPALLAALACGAGAWLGALRDAAAGRMAIWRRWPRRSSAPASAMARWCLLFRSRLPSGTAGAMRLFVALPIPDAVAQSLMLIQGGVPGARWQTREQLHLTLRFIGEVDGRDAAMLDDALAGIDAPAFDLQLHGVGQFGNKQPHALWAAARTNEALEHLQRKVDNAIRRVGQPQDAHKFMPHVTLARLRHPEAGQGAANG